ncbi:cytochrome c [Flavobacterium sp. NRK1]|uniref:cytochrome c n=1 Tax=Flavobacterium sp. NRK1 TaxID=2954929 RepID=UPI002093AD9E|nr:cytochrome c [Flavobacterium sp. NRK1]MCO6147307.1 cytochrome c [Flavobacterium sp. NRK1]
MRTKIYIGLAVMVTAFYSCDSHTYEEIEEQQVIVGKVTYEANVKSIINSNCVSCHAVGEVAGYTPLTTYEEVKYAMATKDLLSRVQRENSEAGVMPQTGRMPQSKVDVIVQWYEDGLLEN